MIITKLESLKSGKVRIYLNDEPAFLLYRGDIKKITLPLGDKLKEGLELCEEVLDSIYEEILVPRCKKRAMNLLLKQDYSRAKLVEKLKNGEYPDAVVDEAIAYVESFGYIDDERYARSYCSYRITAKSRRQLMVDLATKGISKEVATSVLDELYEDPEYYVDEYEIIRKAARKKLGRSLGEEESFSQLTREELDKLYRHLTYKGFEFSKIKHALSDY